MRVLVAEDKPRMARLLQRALLTEGYAVSLAYDGEQALAMGMDGGLDVIVLDVMLPRRDGFNVIQNLRAAKQTVPTIMVTARDDMCDIVRGLDAGADDYLTKPFALDVLLARVRALSRRGVATYPADLRFEDLSLDSRTHQLRRGARVAALTRTEYLLFEALMRRAGCIVPRDTLVEAGWGGGAEVSDGTLYVFIRSLRVKIAPEGERQLLHTARGIGYTIRTEAP
jgi:DNA-binding response OmpR family regulator